MATRNTVERWVSGSLKLGDIRNRIRSIEARFTSFTKCEIYKDGGSWQNRLTFELLRIGDVPKDLKLVQANAAAPAGYKKIWSGTMRVENADIEAAAYRKN